MAVCNSFLFLRSSPASSSRVRCRWRNPGWAWMVVRVARVTMGKPVAEGTCLNRWCYLAAKVAVSMDFDALLLIIIANSADL